MSILTHKFNIGDEVTSKKIGLPMVGVIIGMMIGSEYSSTIQCDIGDSITFFWNYLYPGWQKYLVYIIKYKTGSQVLMDGNESFYGAYPEDDLESII